MAIFDFLSKDKKNDTRKLVELPVASIVPNPNQPRKSFDEDSIAELAKSIEQVGLIQPLMVRMNGQGYELIAGERRLRAVKSLGYETVSCIVCADMKEEDSAIAAVIENLQREDLHFFEEAQCYAELIDSYNLTQEELARRLGKSQSSIANKLRVLRLPDEVKAAVLDSGVTERHARALLKLEDTQCQIDMIKQISEDGMSVKDTERRVEHILDSRYEQKIPGAKPRPAVMRMVKDYRIFMNTINSAVNTLRDTGLIITVAQDDRDDGVDIRISITRE